MSFFVNYNHEFRDQLEKKLTVLISRYSTNSPILIVNIIQYKYTSSELLVWELELVEDILPFILYTSCLQLAVHQFNIKHHISIAIAYYTNTKEVTTAYINTAVLPITTTSQHCFTDSKGFQTLTIYKCIYKC